MRSSYTRWLLLLILVGTACIEVPDRSPPLETEPSDGGDGMAPDRADSMVDAVPDQPADAEPDAVIDAELDAEVDAILDAEADVEVDRGADMALDGDLDAELDQAVDAEIDAEVDAEIDAEVDAVVPPPIDLEFGGCLQPVAGGNLPGATPCLRMFLAAPSPISLSYPKLVQRPDGRVARIGGLRSDGAVVSRVDLYDPTINVWVEAEPLVSGRWGAPVVRSGDSFVILGGGSQGLGWTSTSVVESTAALFEGPWVWEQSRIRARTHHTAHAEADGGIIVAGGQAGSQAAESNDVFRWRSGAQAVQPLASLRVGRTKHAMAVTDDLILVSGGAGSINDADQHAAMGSLEYLPTGGPMWIEVSEAIQGQLARVAAASLVLPSGELFITGGRAGDFGHPGTAERTPSTVRIDMVVPPAIRNAASMRSIRADHTMNFIGPDQRWLLVVGGGTQQGNEGATVEVYDTLTDRWWGFLLPDVANVFRSFHGAVTMGQHWVMVTGGAAESPAGTILDQTLIFRLDPPGGDVPGPDGVD